MARTLVPILYVISLSAFGIRVLLGSSLGQGTLLYIATPFAISVLLFAVTRPAKREGLWWGYLNHLRIATIVFLATSFLLMEGFICVLMFMPIYYLMITIGYIFTWLFRQKGQSRVNSFVLPAIIAVLISEGLLESTTIEREQSATYITTTDQNIAQLKENMAAPISFDKKRGWFLSIFPLPDRIEAGSLGVGDVHRLHFTYKRWVWSNIHHGTMDIRITDVQAQKIQTTITRNTAYLSHYMEIHGTEVLFTPLDNGGTQISLTVKYKRLLDPAWYFGPMQHLAAKQSAKYLVDTIIARTPTKGGKDERQKSNWQYSI